MANLYSPEILRWTTRIQHTGPIELPFSRIRRRSRLCGSYMTLNARIDEGKIVAFSWDLNLCAMGQAVAGMLSEHVIGLDRSNFQKLDAQFRAMVLEGVVEFDSAYEGFALLQVIHDYPGRYGGALLPFDSLRQVFGLADSTAQNAVSEAEGPT